MQASLVEVMSSIQGEGLFVGCRQVFVRLLGCNLACPYCDTPASLAESRQCRVEQTPGKRDFITLENPMTPERAAGLLQHFDLAKHHSISFTGGEPLLHAGFLQEVIQLLGAPRPLIFLETNGILPDELDRVIDWIDIVSMDIKLSGEIRWEDHARFLRLACRKQAYVKIVVLPDTSDRLITEAAALIASIDPALPLVLQPVTPYGAIRRSPSPERMLQVQDLALERLKNVRVIPQTHKLMGQL